MTGKIRALSREKKDFCCASSENSTHPPTTQCNSNSNSNNDNRINTINTDTWFNWAWSAQKFQFNVHNCKLLIFCVEQFQKSALTSWGATDPTLAVQVKFKCLTLCVTKESEMNVSFTSVDLSNSSSCEWRLTKTVSRGHTGWVCVCLSTKAHLCIWFNCWQSKGKWERWQTLTMFVHPMWSVSSGAASRESPKQFPKVKLVECFSTQVKLIHPNVKTRRRLTLLLIVCCLEWFPLKSLCGN